LIGCRYSSWKLNVGQSKNALKRQYPGETLESLAYRMADAMLAQWYTFNVAAVKDKFN